MLGVCEKCKIYGALTKRCSSCRMAHYCNPKCQWGDWSVHKKRCAQHDGTDYDISTRLGRLFMCILNDLEGQSAETRDKINILIPILVLQDATVLVVDYRNPVKIRPTDSALKAALIHALETQSLVLSCAYSIPDEPSEPKIALQLIGRSWLENYPKHFTGHFNMRCSSQTGVSINAVHVDWSPHWNKLASK